MIENTKIQSIPAVAEDIEFLINLRNETMARHFKNAGLTQTMENIRERVIYRLDCAQIIMIDGEKGGLLKVIKNERDWELYQVQIASKYQGKGIGSQIITEVLRSAKQMGAHVRLYVLKKNPAKRLYERLGFKVDKEDIYFYSMST
jgi:ribosomal protein S18 acetylase RimI-like enzyme